MDRLGDYRRKRDARRTPEPVPPADPSPAAGPSPATDAPLAADTSRGAGASPPEAGDAGVFVVQEHHARRLHWDLRLERDGVLVSWALPKGVPDDPAVNHLAVHTEDHPLEYATFHGEIPKGEYGAGSMTIWDHGTYKTDKWTDREVKVTLHGQRLHGGYVLFATDRDGGRNWMIHRERLPLPTSVAPMLASPGRPPDRELDGWGVEMKWDGVRALAFCENGRTQLRSRTGKDITATYPELAGIARETGRRQVLLDGEIVAFGPTGQPDFEALQPRMHVSSAAHAARLAGTTPVTFLAFDVLQLDGRPVTGLTYADRRELLEPILGGSGGSSTRASTANGSWLLCPPYFPGSDLEAVRDVSVARGLEGVVVKRLDSRYEPGARAATWLKVKNQLSQEVVVAGWKPGKGNREGLIGSLLIGVYSDDGDLIYCGHVGTGFTDKTLRMLTAKLRPLRRADNPFDGPVPPEYARPAVWVEPRLVVEVTFQRWTRAGRMRAPAYRGLRDDKDPETVIRET